MIPFTIAAVFLSALAALLILKYAADGARRHGADPTLAVYRRQLTEIDERVARYVNDNLADYQIPVNADIGEVDIILVPEEDSEVNPAGVKGLGELGNVGTAAAVTNAVFHATGIRVRELPVRLEKLLIA